MPFQIQVSSANDSVAMVLHGMQYQPSTDCLGSTEKYKEGERVEYIALSDDLCESLRASVLDGTVSNLTLELLALEALTQYFKGISRYSFGYVGIPKIASTSSGSIVMFTEYGEILGAILKHAKDFYVIKQLASRFPRAVTWAEVGTVMYAILDKCDEYMMLNVIDGVVKFGVIAEQEIPVRPVDTKKAVEDLDLELWEISK